MYVLAIMEDWELERLKKGGNKERYLAVYFSAPNMPKGVTRLYVAFLGDFTTQGYFEVHEQYRNTVAMWSEDFVGEKVSVTNFSHIIGTPSLVSAFKKQKKAAKKTSVKKKTKKKKMKLETQNKRRQNGKSITTCYKERKRLCS